MILRLLRAVMSRLSRWTVETPRKEFVHCGPSVILAPYIRATFPDRVRFGSNIYVGPHVFFSSQGGLVIEDGAIIGPYVHIYTASHRYEGGEAVPYDGAVVLRAVTIRRNVWIGGDVVIVPGVTIGEGAVVGAGAVVVRDVPDMAVVGGNPAKVLKYRDRDHYERMKRGGNITIMLKLADALPSSEIKDFGL